MPRPLHRFHALAAVLAFLFAGVSAAQAPAPAKEPQALGRLFFTPQQRQELDRRRALNIQEAIVVRENRMRLDGYVARSSGKTTTWVNGVPVNDLYRSKDPSQVAIQPGEGEPSVSLKVGQTLDKTRAAITDDLGGGRVGVDPAPARR